MKAMIVAGGRGERLRPLTDKIPKPMIEISEKPILLHIIELLKENGISEIIITLCYLPDVITSFFGNGEKFGVSIKYLFEDPDFPLGTAGAINSAKEFIDGAFIVTYADILRELDVKKMIDFHNKQKPFATINVYKRQGKDTKSMVILDSDNKVVEFIERPEVVIEDEIWVNGSFYIFEPEIFDYIEKNKKSDFGSEIFPNLIKSQKTVLAFPTDGYFVDIGNMEKLEYARKTFQK